MNRSRSSLVFVVCAIYSLIGGLYPFEFCDRAFAWGFREAIPIPIKDVGLSDFLQNIVYSFPGVQFITFSPHHRTGFPVL